MDTSATLGFRGSARFIVQRRLGEGGMGVVYLAHDVERDILVALKTLSRLDPADLWCLKNEFRSICDVAHPNLVRLHELISEDGQWLLTMELVDGVSFLNWVQIGEPTSPQAAPEEATASYLAPKGETEATPSWNEPPSVESAMRRQAEPARKCAPSPWCDLGRLRLALRQLVEGVLAIHSAGKLHRDLKPSNVLVTREGRVVILDFGLAIAQDGRSQRAAGTPGFMAPEQVSSQALTPASDWYAVGAIIYQALTGQLPFTGTAADMLREKQTRAPRPPSTLAAGIPADLEQLCMDCLSQEPSHRPSGSEILRRLDGAPARASVRLPFPEAALFLGREQQLAQLREAFTSVQQGRAVTVYVSGRSGMGKTALIQRFLSELRERKEALVLTGRCFERESMPYKAWDSLIDALAARLGSLPLSEVMPLLPKHIHELVRVFPVLRELGIMPAPQEQPSPEEHQSQSRQRAFDALKELLHRLAKHQPLVLSIDDLQWGDFDSARLMASLLSAPAPPLLLVCNYRSEEEHSSEFFHALRELSHNGTLKLGEVRRIEVDRLSVEDGTQLAFSLLGPLSTGAENLPSLIAREGDGSPFFIAEFARHIRTREELPSEAALQELSLERVLLHRVRRLPERAQRLLEILSVAAQPLEQGLAASAAGLGTDATVELGTLRAERLIRTHGARSRDLAEPYHDRIRETVARALDAVRLQDCHRQLASALEASGKADPELIASHLEGAGEVSRAAGYAILAAERAEAALAFERAAKLYQRALARSAPEHAAQLRLRLASALINAGRGAQAAPLLLEEASGRSHVEAIELRRRAAEQLLVSGHMDEGARVLRDVLSQVGIRYPETTGRAVLSVLINLARLRLRGTRFRERSAAEISSEQLLRIDICYSAGKGLVLVDSIRGYGFLLKELLLALGSGEPRRVALGLCHYATNLGIAGQPGYPRAKALLAQAQALGERLDDPFVLGTVGHCQAAVEMCIGQWRKTVELVTRTNEVLRKRCNGAWWEINSGVVFAETSLLFMGRLHELSELVRQHASAALDRGDLFAATYSRVLTWYEPIAADDVERASAQLRETMRRWSQGGFHIMHFWALYGETQYALYAGDTAAARERISQAWPALASSTLLRIQFFRILITLLRGSAAVAAAHTGQGGHTKQLLRAAEGDAVRLAKERTGWADAAASLLRACILGASGRSQEALPHLDAAIQGFDAAEMALHAACARRRKGQLLGGDEGRALVADADALMIGQGIRNPARWTALYAPGFSFTPC